MINAIHTYRAARWLHLHHVPVLPRLLDFVARILFSCWVPHTAKIGRRVVLGYGGLGIVIHGDATIGDDSHIDQHVTIGGTATKFGTPQVGRGVYIGAGAKILGPIVIGDEAIIGANAVVIKDVPGNSVAVGIPARVVKSNVDAGQHLAHRRPAKDGEATR
jgi:serine O-acetyltransferase